MDTGGVTHTPTQTATFTATPTPTPTNAASSVDVRIASGSDDVEQRVSDGFMSILDSTDLELVVDGSIQQLVGLRFNNLTIPQGATITGASLEFQADETSVNFRPIISHMISPKVYHPFSPKCYQ